LRLALEIRDGSRLRCKAWRTGRRADWWIYEAQPTTDEKGGSKLEGRKPDLVHDPLEERQQQLSHFRTFLV
jgi:hypothetical protein